MNRQRRRGSFSNLGKKFETIREVAEGLVVRTQEAMGRAEHHQCHSPYEQSDIEHTLSKTTAKRISVVIYLISVTILAVIAAFYYALSWRPPTARIFNWTKNDTV